MYVRIYQFPAQKFLAERKAFMYSVSIYNGLQRPARVVDALTGEKRLWLISFVNNSFLQRSVRSN